MPVGEDINDWYAVNVTDFFNEISLLYGAPRPRVEEEAPASSSRTMRTRRATRAGPHPPDRARTCGRRARAQAC